MMALNPPPTKAAPRDRDTDADRSDRHASDQRLRRFGFVIASRPARGEPTWRFRGKGPEYTAAQAEVKIGFILGSLSEPEKKK